MIGIYVEQKFTIYLGILVFTKFHLLYHLDVVSSAGSELGGIDIMGLEHLCM